MLGRIGGTGIELDGKVALININIVFWSSRLVI
jgi:hypothetical protein